jgi:eukaryotic-like serine/threonine-protein kinase
MNVNDPVMQPEPQREAALFQAAVQLAGEARVSFLDNACRGDAALRQRLDALLSAHEQSEGVLAEHAPTGQGKATLKLELSDGPQDETVGQKIGRYKVMEQVGEGGCGVVYVAEQTEPVRRRVALKVIKLGMDTKQVVARFEAERQALAMMDHPNIAKVLDAGTTEAGRPYFIMELVRGIRITDYCDKNNLPTRERLDLFIQVCHAIQHAHQKGIIHRDIKPSNILVTLHDGVPVPKVIDFGIAKATEGRLTDATVYTQLNQFIGTPAYMSPEQAEMSGLDIDTRSDIYSLGVLLYELLTGRTPFDAQELMSQGIEAMRKTIREQEPVPPSTRLGTLQRDDLTTTAKRRSVESATLTKLLRGDLDWIVMTCLEKDRTRRYETANGLAMDIKRHLHNEPVAARPPSKLYEFQKSVRRHKVAFAAGVTVMLVLAVGIVATTWEAARAQREARRATAAEKHALSVLDELRASAPAFAEQAHALAAREQFDDAIAKLDYAIKLRPDVAEYLVAKADLLQCQLKLADAAGIYREALRVKPGLPRAQESAQLCDDLLRSPRNDQDKLTRESLAKLHVAMQKQQRPAAELLPVARLLGEDEKLLVEYWLERLKDLPVSAERPLKERLSVREDGRLALDLSGTKVIDLSPLAGAPLGELDVSDSGELTDLAPLRGLNLVELNISGTAVTDLAALRKMYGLRKLNLADSKVTDLTPLNALRLDDLNLKGTHIFDIGELRGMKLKTLNLRNTRVNDLSPLAGMPLTFFDATSIPAVDYSPLAGAPLEKCWIQDSPVRDLSFLRNSPVKELVLYSCNEARGYSVLAGLKSLDLLVLPQSFRSLPDEDLAAIGALRTHPTLRNIQTEYRSGGGWKVNTTQPKEIFWQDWDREQPLVLALRKSGIKYFIMKLPTGTYSLDMQNQPLYDISILKGAPISELNIASCRVADLAPLRDLPLEILNTPNNPITDLSPLRGKQIKTLYLTSTMVSDLSPLTSLPLENLYLGACEKVTNLAALTQISTLESLVVPVQAANIEALRKLPKLQRLSYQLTSVEPYIPDATAAEFWKADDGAPWVRSLRESNFAVKSLECLPNGTWKMDLSGTKGNDLTVLKGASISSLNLDSSDVADLSPLRGMPLRTLNLDKTRISDLGPLRGMQIEDLSLANSWVADLSVLRGMPLKTLQIGGTAVTDLEPLRGMALVSFLMYDTKIADLSPLTGMPLHSLHLGGSKVKDLSVLRGMPLTYLRLHTCSELIDVSPLADCKALQSLTLSPNATNIESLRTLPQLERIGFMEDHLSYQPDETAEEFWKDYDAKKKAGN